MLTGPRAVVLAALLLMIPSLSAGQTTPSPAVEFLAGYAGFVDDAMIDHAIAGGAARVYLTPRVAIGPEFVYMRGPRADRDLFLTGNLTFDVLSPRQGRPARVTPFLVVGGGVMRHSNSFGGETFTSSEGAFTAGGGVRGWITDRVYVLGDFRIGWEPHVRVNGGVGIALGR